MDYSNLAPIPNLVPQNRQSMVGNIVSQGLGAIGGLISGLGQKRRDKLNQIRQHKYNMELADHNFAKNLEMWQLQNEYNTPRQQMQRLKDAGINPHLAYAKGGIQNQAGTQPQYQQEGQDMSLPMAINPSSILSQYQDFRQRDAQVNLTQRNADYTQRKAETEELNQSLKALGIIRSGLDNRYRAKELNYQEQFIHKNLRMLETDIGKKLAETASTNAGIKQIQANTRMLDATTGLRWRQATTEISKRNLTDEQAKTELVKRGLISEQTKTEDAKRILMTYQMANLGSQTEGQNWINQYRKDTGIDPYASFTQYFAQGYQNFKRNMQKQGWAW